MNSIVIVAPYTGNSNNKSRINLGASKKIRFIISVLYKVCPNIILINSAHNDTEERSFTERKIIMDENEIIEIVLPTKKNSTIGKFWNLFHINAAMGYLEKKSPMLFWFYNGYAFEMLFSKLAKKKYNVPQVLEVEDWFFARNRNFNIKNWIDYLCWRRSAFSFAKIYAINHTVKGKLSPFCDDIALLPGIITDNLVLLGEKKPFIHDEINIGYFGGLSKEKGADKVLELSRNMSNYKFHITGTGELRNKFEENKGNNLNYYGMVNDKSLLEIISKCDIILNPHIPINNFGEGIFPFKVIEAIASGRLLISTEVSFDGFSAVSEGVYFVEDKIEEFEKAIYNANDFYNQNIEKIEKSRLKAIELFGEKSLLKSVNEIIMKYATS